MSSSIDRYSKDIAALVARGRLLEAAMVAECYPDQAEKWTPEVRKRIPVFASVYQSWYSEAVSCLAQLLPHRVDDFKALYASGKARKEVTAETYTVKDYLFGLTATTGEGPYKQVLVPTSTAIPYFRQQVRIVEALEKRFSTSLYDIRLLLQADFFDDELEVAKELNRKGFTRASGAVAGVVLEGHLREVGERHFLKLAKSATLGVILEALKRSDTVDTPEWRRLQHLTDIRNLCDHKLKDEPTTDQVNDLIAGTQKTIKTVF